MQHLYICIYICICNTFILRILSTSLYLKKEINKKNKQDNINMMNMDINISILRIDRFDEIFCFVTYNNNNNNKEK